MQGRELPESPLRPFLASAGVLLVAAGMVYYSIELYGVVTPTPAEASRLTAVADAFLVVFTLGIILVLVDLWRVFRIRSLASRVKGVAPLSPSWILPYVLSQKRYRAVFAVSTVAYGLFYSVITSMVVYQPAVDFTQAYGAAIPSLVVTPLNAAPLYTPVITVYLLDHLGLLLVPLTVVLALVISLLVGLNSSLAAFAFDSRSRGASRSWVGGVGAVVGLFTGCPTCAGLFFANVLGGTGAVAFVSILGYYQPVFVLLSIPVLVATPYLISRSLSKVFREGCVVLDRNA